MKREGPSLSHDFRFVAMGAGLDDGAHNEHVSHVGSERAHSPSLGRSGWNGRLQGQRVQVSRCHQLRNSLIPLYATGHHGMEPFLHARAPFPHGKAQRICNLSSLLHCLQKVVQSPPQAWLPLPSASCLGHLLVRWPR